MAERRRKLLASSVVLLALFASVVLTSGLFRNIERSFAQSPTSVAASDFYIPSGSDPWGTAFDSAGRVWLAVPGCDPSPMCGQGTPPGKIEVYDPNTTSWVNTYSLPGGYGQPLFLAFDSQGRVWFAMPMTNSIGMLNPGTQQFQQWFVPTANSGPWGIAIDSHGKVWFTEHYTNQIGYFDPSTSTFKEFATPAANSNPYGIVIDASDNVWFTENNSAVAQIGEYTAQGQLLEYKIRNGSTNGLTPHQITIDPNGNVWWTEGWATSIGELRVSQAVPGTNNGVTEYKYTPPCSSCSSHTSGISVDTYGQVWFDDALQSIYGTFPDSGNGSFTLYPTPTSSSHPHDGLNVDAQNRIWFDEEFKNKLAVVHQTVSAPPSPTASSSPTVVASPSPTVVVPSPSPTPGCPVNWACADIGNPALAGSQSLNGNTWTLQAGGNDIWSTADQFHYVWQQISADGSVSARITSLASTSAWAKAGVMLRQTTDPGSPYYAMLMSKGNGIVIQWRTAQGLTTQQIGGIAGTPPAFLQVSCAGSVYSAYTSSDGVHWTLVPKSSVTLNMGGSLLAGLAFTSHNAKALGTAAFDTVNISGATTPPPTPTPSPSPSPTPSPSPSPSPSTTGCGSGWNCADIGAPTLAGSQTLSGGTWTIQAAGADIWNTADQFHYVWQSLPGDGSVSAHITSLTSTSAWAKAGVMLRQTTNAGSMYYAILVTKGNGIVIQWRTAQGATTHQIGGITGTAPTYIAVARQGNLYTAYTSSDGVHWTLVPKSSVTMSGMSGAVLAGMAFTSHNAKALGTVTFDTVNISATIP